MNLREERDALRAQVAALQAGQVQQFDMATMVAQMHAVISKQAPAAPPTLAESAHTVRSLAALYIKSPEFGMMKDPESEMGRMRNLLRHLGDVRIGALDYKVMDGYRAARRPERGSRKDTTKPSTRNHEVKRLRVICAWGVKHKEIPDNPLTNIAMEKENNKRRTLITPELLTTVMKHVNKRHRLRWQAMLAVTFWGGFRRTEVCELRLAQLDWKTGLINLEEWDTKTGRPRVTLFPTEVQRLVRMYLDERKGRPREASSKLVFCTSKGTAVGSRNFLEEYQSAWHNAKLDLVHGEAPWLHDLRAGFVSLHVKNATPETVIMSMSGHKTHAAFDRYCRQDARTFGDALKVAEAAGRKPPKRSEPPSDEEGAVPKPAAG